MATPVDNMPPNVARFARHEAASDFRFGLSQRGVVVYLAARGSLA